MGYLQNIKKSFQWKNALNYFIIVAVLIVMILLNQAGALGKGDRSMLTRIAFSAILAVSLNLVVGFLGELSLGHAGFMCVGAYIGCFFANFLRSTMGGGELLIFILSMLLGGLVAALFGFIVGMPALRLKGDYLAIATLAFGEIVRNIFKNLSLFGGAMGLSTQLYDSNSLFIVAIVTLLVVLFLSQNFIRSKHGRAVTAIRDNEIAARAMGINVTFYKLIVFVIAAFFAGVAGVIYGQTFGTVRQETFSYNYSIEILVMVVLGGMGSINGSLIAAAIITYVNIALQNELSGPLAPVKSIVYAVILIGIVLFNNAPGLKSIKEKLSIRNFMKKKSHRHNAPEVIQDDDAAWNRIETKIEMDELLSVELQPNEKPAAEQKEGEEE
jgi:high-affinity branched-chain amino acid transport system permease protein braE